jgi:hypothetical protein
MEPLLVCRTLSFKLVDPQKISSKTTNLAILGLLRDFFLIFTDFNVICRRIRIPLLSHSQEIGYFCNI